MRKRVLISLISAFLIVSCNLLQAPPLATPTVQISREPVLTAVAATLTAKPLTIPSQPATPAPPVTSTATLVTPTSTETPKPTSTPKTSATPTFTSTPDDITASLGQPTWKSTFDNSSAFFQKGVNSYEDDHTRFVISGGIMTISSYGSPNWVGWRLTYPTPKNFYLEAYFHTQECSGKDRYGLVYRAPDYESGNGYYYGFTCDGEYMLSRSTDSGKASPVSWTSSDIILAGSGQNNRMGVWISGDTIKLYANGKLLQELTDSGILDAGHFGAFIAYALTSNFTVEMDNIAYWNIP